LRVAIADTGAIFATLDPDDSSRDACLEVFAFSDLQIVIPALVVTEVCQLIKSRLGPATEAGFLASLAHSDVRLPVPEDWLRIAELVERYADFPLGAMDASVVALAERLDTDLVITLDRRHFSAVRPKHCTSFQLLPS
jgi:uncharacterized protein